MVYEKKNCLGGYFCPATNREGKDFWGKMRISGKIIQYLVMFTDSPLSPRYEDDNLRVGTCPVSLSHVSSPGLVSKVRGLYVSVCVCAYSASLSS